MTKFFHVWIVALSTTALAVAQSGSQGSSSSGGNSASRSAAGAPTGSGAGSSNSAFLSSLATDPSYRLSVGDQIQVSIYDEPELTSNELIDRDGVAKLSLIKETKLEGLTVREAEAMIEKQYKVKNILKEPSVKLVVTGFNPREIILFGEVKGAGAMAFPRDVTQMDIVEVITRAGGFTVRAKSSEVIVTRKVGDNEVSKVVNVDAMMSARGGVEKNRAEFPIFPGDRITVKERLF